MIKIDFAPLEGITGYSFRNAYEASFGGVTRYFTPFVNVNQNLKFGSREERDLTPENNQVPHLVPQLLTNHSDQLAWGIQELYRRGFREINLNLGCPSGTVMKRHRGAGMLENSEELGVMLQEAVMLCEKQGISFYSGSVNSLDETKDVDSEKVRFSVKTRIGMSDAGRMEELVSVYNQLPLSEVIVHPRIGTQGYGGVPDCEKYGEFLEKSVHPVIYNGDIWRVEDAKRIIEEFPKTAGLMLGRGALKDPYLPEMVEKILGNQKVATGNAAGDIPTVKSVEDKHHQLKRYHDHLFRNYLLQMGEDRNAMARMKEFWIYFGNGPHFRGDREKEKALKEIRKAKNKGEYEVAVEKMFSCLI